MGSAANGGWQNFGMAREHTENLTLKQLQINGKFSLKFAPVA
jgi:hypothetical protein